MRCLFIATIVFGTLIQTGFASDYLLRLRVVGYEDAPATANVKPKEIELRQIAIPVTVGVPFSERLVHGRRILAASGTLIRLANGKHTINKFKFQDQVETDGRILDRRGNWKPAFNGSTYRSSSADVGFGMECVLAGDSSETDRTNPDGSKDRLLSKSSYTIQLLKSDTQAKSRHPKTSRWQKFIRSIFPR
jgi:hypothetical protein